MNFSQDIRVAISAWRKYSDALQLLRRRAEQRPAAAAFAFDLAAEELQRRALMDLYFFGVLSPQSRYAQRLESIEDQETEARRRARFYETYYGDPDKYEELAAQGVFDAPKEKAEALRKGPSLNFDEELEATLAAIQHETCQAARLLMDIAGESSRAAGHGFYGIAVCEAFLEAFERFPVIFTGRVQQKWGGDPRTRSRALQSLTGWVRTRISLNANPRLKAALDNVEGSSAFNQLLETLGGAVAIEWASLQPDEPLAVLVTRTALRLEKEGDEATKLNLKGKLVAEELGGSLNGEEGWEDADLTEFELQETLRQESKRLKEWAASAEFSPREAQMHELDMRTNFDTAAAAHAMGVSENKARDYRSRYVKKLRQVAGF